jgi:hypothetical protein
MTDDIEECLDPEEEQEIPLEPLPAFAEQEDYLKSVSGLPIPTTAQIDDFVTYAAGAKSWYKHLPCRPPGAPMHFYLDPNAGRDRLRRWDHQVIYRDRTENTEKFHYSWMTTEEYRRRFGYLAYCCAMSTGIWTDEVLQDGVATLDPNVSEPLIEGEPGRLLLVPEAVLEAGTCLVTRAVHARTDAASFWKKWNKTGEQDINLEPLTGLWPRIALLCEELGRETPGVYEYLSTRPYPLPPLTPDSYPADKEAAVKHVKALEGELNALIKKQRAEDHDVMASAINAVLEFVRRTVRPAS